MKKLLFALVILIVLALSYLYIFIPRKITISKSLKIEASRDGLLRKLGNIQTWKEWWPGNQEGKDTSAIFLLNDIIFIPEPAKTLSIPLTIITKNFEIDPEFTFISLGTDSTTIHIETSIPVSYNPFKRISTYFKSNELEKSLSQILESISKTYSKVVNLYNYDIQKRRVVDSILVFTSGEVKGYPSVSQVYALIDELKDYIKKNSASETGLPMQNIFTADSVNYVIKVAIPVNKRLPDSGKISYRWMLGGGNILITEVRGDQTEINKAYTQILNYISDYNRVAPAIPFESLVTDRRTEPDSSKWITRIYYPVM